MLSELNACIPYVYTQPIIDHHCARPPAGTVLITKFDMIFSSLIINDFKNDNMSLSKIANKILQNILALER